MRVEYLTDSELSDLQIHIGTFCRLMNTFDTNKTTIQLFPETVEKIDAVIKELCSHRGMTCRGETAEQKIIAETTKINILGTDYNFTESKEELDSRLENADGYHDGYAKIICINNDYNENHSSAIRNFPEYRNKVKRHEIIHAFLHESGLTKYTEDELLVDWLAIQFHKMLSTFQKIDCI